MGRYLGVAKLKDASYWLARADEFEHQMTALIREYKGDGEYLSPYRPAE